MEQIIHPVKLHKIIDNYYYTYVLKSLFDNNLYVGFISNLLQRFESYNLGRVPSTKNRKPLKLKYFEGCLSRDDAIKREKYLKTHYGKMFLRKRLKSYLTG